MGVTVSPERGTGCRMLSACLSQKEMGLVHLQLLGTSRDMDEQNQLQPLLNAAGEPFSQKSHNNLSLPHQVTE